MRGKERGKGKAKRGRRCDGGNEVVEDYDVCVCVYVYVCVCVFVDEKKEIFFYIKY